MKHTLPYWIVLMIGASTGAFAQGWYAEVDLDLNHDLYAYENIARATLTFSGVTVSGSSSTSKLHLELKGINTITGDLSLSINGVAWQPYDPIHPYSEPISARFSGRYNISCETGFFEQDGDTPLHQVYIWIKIYPRLQISDFVQACDKITLTSSTCSPSYRWEVSDSSTGNFKALSGKTTSSIIVTRQELIALGFANTNGRKYFRVSGQQNTTSQLQAVDIYYPGPAASLTSSPPKCHNGTDGSINLTITSSLPSIDDFVVTLFRGIPPQNQVQQNFITNGSEIAFSSVGSDSYWVRVENNTNKDLYGNCWTDYAVGTLRNPEPVVLTTKLSDYGGYSVKCAGSRDGKIEVFPSGGSGTYTVFKWFPQVSVSNVATGLGAGNYQVSVMDSNGCSSAELTTIIREPDKLAVALISTGGRNGYDISCAAKSDGVIEAHVSGGVPAYNYSWSNGNTTQRIKDLPPGDYTLLARDANQCIAQSTISLKAPAPIDFTITQLNGIKCPGDQTGALEISSAKNTIGDIFYSWSSGETGKDIIDKGSGTYAATVSDTQGCSTTKQYVLIEPFPYSSVIGAASDFNGRLIRCYGEASGELQAMVYDPTGAKVSGHYYTWYRNGVWHQAGNALSTLTDVDAGNYKVEIHYTPYCKTEAEYAVSNPEPLMITAQPVTDYNGMAISCNGSADGGIRALSSGGTGAVTYTWDNQQSGPQLNGLSKGTYAVTGKDANGCEARAEVVLEDPEAVEATITVLSNFGGQALSCWDASDARLSASAKGGIQPYKYTWSNGQTAELLFGLPQGEYTLTTLDANGCVDIVKTTVQPPAQLKVKIAASSNYHGYGASCNGTTDGFLLAEAWGGTGNFKYLWPATNIVSPLHTNLPAGTHTVIAMDANGCSAQVDGIITNPPKLTAEAIHVRNLSCYGGTDGEIRLQGEGGTGVYMYSATGTEWQSESSLTQLGSGTFNAQVRDENGCRAETFVSLTQPKKIVVGFDNVKPALCGDPKGEASVVVSGGAGGYSYWWHDSENKVVGNTPAVSGLRAGIFSVTVEDANYCQAKNYTSITSMDGPKVNITDIFPASCSYNADGKARIEVMAGNGPFSIQWQNGQTTYEADGLGNGVHLVQVTDANDCAVVESVNLPAPDELTVEVVEIAKPHCNGDCNGAVKVRALGGNGTYSYDWENFDGPEISNLCAGEYSVTVTDAKNCVATHLINLTQPASLELKEIFRQSPPCPDACDGKLEVMATGGTGELELEWADGYKNTRMEKLCDGTYTATVRDTHGCTTTETFTLQSPEVRSLDLGASLTLCEGQSHTLDAGEDWKTLVWSGNNGFHSTSRFVTLSDAGMYALQATTHEGCVSRDTFFLETSNDLLNAMFLLASQAFVKDTVVIIDISWPMPEAVTWRLPDAMKQLESSSDVVVGQFHSSGDYEVGITASLGKCRDELRKIITILDHNAPNNQGGRLTSEDFLKEFMLYPNPNDGMFDVAVEFARKSAMVLTVWNILTSRKVAQFKASGRTSYLQHIDLRPLSAGSYSLRLDYESGTRYVRFIVR